jgi:aspartate oxidase
LTLSAGFDECRRHVTTQLAAKNSERVLTLFRRGVNTADEAEHELDAVAREAGQLREELEAMRASSAY